MEFQPHREATIRGNSEVSKSSISEARLNTISLRDYVTTITILEHLNNAVCFLDSEGRIEYANSAALQMLDYPKELLRGQLIDTFLVNFEEDSLLNPSTVVFIRRMKMIPIENIEATLRGRTRDIPVIIDCYPIKSSSQSETYYLFSAKDISRQRESESERNKRQALTIYHGRIRTASRFSINLIHAISQPLLALQLQTDLLRQNFDKYKKNPRRVKQKLDQIVQLINRLTEIVNSNRKFAEAGEEEHFEWIRLEDVVNCAFALLAYEFEVNHFYFKKDIPADLPPILSPPLMLIEAIYNLIRNSLDSHLTSTLAKNRQIYLRGREIKDDWIEVIIEDNAPAIPAEYRETIFNPLFTSKSNDYQTNWELTVSQKIFEYLGGDLTYKSNSTNHNCFIARIPISVMNERSFLNNLIKIHHHQTGE